MKHRSLFAAVALATAALAISMTPSLGGVPAAAATAPPTPPPLPTTTTAPAAAVTPTPQPFALPTLTPQKRPAPGATGTPAPPKGANIRKGIEGVWEVQIQRGAKTEYDHFQLTQSDTAITGTFLDTDKKKFPLAGSLDGKTIRIVVTYADGTTAIFSAQLDGTTDMLGIMTTAKETTPFTAGYRPKESFFDNINPAPGGMGGSGGGGMPPR